LPCRGDRYRDGSELGINLMPRRGSKLGPYAFTVTLIRSGRHWLVDTFQPAATFRADECGRRPR